MPRLTRRQRWTWAAHFFKAVTYQYHRPFALQVGALLAPDGIVIDAGAHAGQFSKLFSRMVPRGTVYAFEPGGYALSILRPVMRLRRRKNVRVVPFGLSDSAEVAVLRVPLKGTGSVGFGLSHIARESSPVTRPMVVQKVTLMRLDDFVREQGLTRLDFIKADIEGWELHLLRGARASLRKFRPALLLEISEKSLRRAGTVPAEIFAEFASLNYRFFRTAEHQDYRLWPAAGYEGPGDYLCVPQEKAGQVPLAA